MLQTEFAFNLPMGYVDPDGSLHKDGVMRLSTAADELLPAKDPRVRQNEAYLAVILLSRVVVRLGSLEMVTPKVIENLFTADFAFLQEMYRRINLAPDDKVQAVCPKCAHQFELDGASPVGEP